MSVVGLLAVVTTGALLAADLRPFPAPSEPEQISGPYASLLALSKSGMPLPERSHELLFGSSGGVGAATRSAGAGQ